MIATYTTDFASTLDDDLFPIRADELAELGSIVFLYDDEGNSCWGRVEQVEGPLAMVRPYLETWMTPADFERPVTSGPPLGAQAATTTTGATLGQASVPHVSLPAEIAA